MGAARRRPSVENMTLNPALRVVDLVRTYGSGDSSVRAVDHVSLDIAANQLTAIMGPSGSGKSTLMHCAAGLDRPDGGQVIIGDSEITALDDDALTLVRRDQISFVFQSFNLLPTMTAADNIRLPLRLAKKTFDEDWFASVVRMLDIEERLGHLPSEMSGGQQQRVAIARALITRPRVIFADEPTGALDQATSHTIMSFLRRSTEELSQTVVMVTHDPAASAWAHRIVELTDGRISDDRMAA